MAHLNEFFKEMLSQMGHLNEKKTQQRKIGVKCTLNIGFTNIEFKFDFKCKVWKEKFDSNVL